MIKQPLSANPYREVPRVEGVYRGAPRSVGASDYGKRTLLEDTTTRSQQRTDVERRKCTVCGKMVAVRLDGEIRSHHSRRGIQCVGSTPVISSVPMLMCETHGEYRIGGSIVFACGCRAPRKPRSSSQQD